MNDNYIPHMYVHLLVGCGYTFMAIFMMSARL